MTVTISMSRSTKPASSIFSLTFMLKSRRETPSRARIAMWPPVEDRNRHEVEQPEIEADHRHQREERDPAVLLCRVAERLAIATGPISCFTEV